jgi:hypothetical protein
MFTWPLDGHSKFRQNTVSGFMGFLLDLLVKVILPVNPLWGKPCPFSRLSAVLPESENPLITTGPLTDDPLLGGRFAVLQWKEGLTVVLVDDIDGGYGVSGSGFPGGPAWRVESAPRAADGRQVSWRVETTDGKTAAMFINEQEYDLVQGTLFLIRTRGGQTRVMQHHRNRAGRCSDYEECQLLLKDDPRVMQFIQETLNSQ